MAERRMRSLVLKRMNMVLVIGCVLGLLSGCSSRLRTTMVSGSEAPKVQVTPLNPEQLVAKENIAQPITETPIMGIPVEEPTKPVIQREVASDIFATSKTPDLSSEIVAPFKSAPAPTSAPPSEQTASSMPLRADPAMQQPMAGIPAISIEPEMPALPKRAHDEVSSASPAASVLPAAPVPSVVSSDVQLPFQPQPVQPAAELSQDSPVEEPQVVVQANGSTTPESSTEIEPMQVVKVMPQDPGRVAMTTEVLEAALSDIYFDYDQFLIRDDAMSQLQVNAQLLTAKLAGKHIVIEGHCDERGTQSYNMVLGKRRAHAVKRFLEHLGVPTETLQAVSYGKDKPFCTDSTQDCWQENRRGHFLIQ